MSATCDVEGCDKPRRRREFCGAHHLRFLRFGDPLLGARDVRPMPECVEAGCSAVSVSRRSGLCALHNRAFLRTGSTDPLVEARQRLLSRMVVNVETWCWEWTGGRMHIEADYGEISIAGEKMPAHRASWILLRGPIPEGLTIDHLCRVHCCVNPDHLEPVTQAENNRRAHGGKTHCVHGHEFTPENTYLSREGWRSCVICRLAKKQREKEARRAVRAKVA